MAIDGIHNFIITMLYRRYFPFEFKRVFRTYDTFFEWFHDLLQFVESRLFFILILLDTHRVQKFKKSEFASFAFSLLPSKLQ